MEVLVRLLCRCAVQARSQCPQCDGRGYVDQWLPYDMLCELKGWIILNRRVKTANS
jgi:hypothetical protein